MTNQKSAIFTLSKATGKLVRMNPSAPQTEDYMQKLVADYPEIITDEDGDLLLIKREQEIGDSEDSLGRWSIDHLFVTRQAVPVLVELKRAVDTRLRREIVGQMLDYAANGSAYWRADKLAESFGKSAADAGTDAHTLLTDFLNDDDDIESFWQQIDANLSAGRMKLVFVADKIPSELARVVEFLNDQMRAEVRAVELSWFESADGSLTLAPRIIGQTEQTKASKKSTGQLPLMSITDWINERLSAYGHPRVKTAFKFIDLMENLGAEIFVTSTHSSIMTKFIVSSQKCFPFSLSDTRQGSISFSLGYIKKFTIFRNEAARQDIYDTLVAIVGPLSNSNINGHPSFPLSKLSDPVTANKFVDFVNMLLQKIERD